MRYDFVTFDCYGTLIDWEGGIAEAFCRAGIRVDRATLLRAYHDQEPRVEGMPYKSYREVLTETAVRVARTLGRDLTPAEASFLPESLPSWKPFPDTNRALEALRSGGCELGILSNVDDDLLAETQRSFPVDFQLLITAQQVKSYKPAHGHFLAAQERLRDRRWLHAAQSYFHDVVPATELGVPVAWINRKGEQSGRLAPAIVEFRDLRDFAVWCTS